LSGGPEKALSTERLSRFSNSQKNAPGSVVRKRINPSTIEIVKPVVGGTPAMLRLALIAISRVPQPAKEIGSIAATITGGTRTSAAASDNEVPSAPARTTTTTIVTKCVHTARAAVPAAPFERNTIPRAKALAFAMAEIGRNAARKDAKPMS
jgi:hypothetical protein